MASPLRWLVQAALALAAAACTSSPTATSAPTPTSTAPPTTARPTPTQPATATTATAPEPTRPPSAPAPTPTSFSGRPRIDLNGSWRFALDPDGAGRARGWAGRPDLLSASIAVPGCWQAQGFGDRDRYLKSLAQAHRLGAGDTALLNERFVLRSDYAGAAWYGKSILVPGDWLGKRVWLKVGGAARRAEIYVNGVLVGSHDGFSAPFRIDVTGAVRSGRENALVLAVSNMPETGLPPLPWTRAPAEMVGTFNYLGNWGGVFGEVWLEATGDPWVEAVHIAPDLARGAARLEIDLGAVEGATFQGKARVEVTGPGGAGPFSGTGAVRLRREGTGRAEVTVSIPGARPWSPEDPYLYGAMVTLEGADGKVVDGFARSFGMRETTTSGGVLRLNGQPYYVRAFGDDNIEVITGCPPASREANAQRLRLARAMGFNAVRRHSMVPPEQYYEAADEVGILVMAELPVVYVPHFLPTLPKLKPQLLGALAAYRDHPSFFSISMGNELDPSHFKDGAELQRFRDAIKDLYETAKKAVPEVLVLSNAGEHLLPSDLLSLPAQSAMTGAAPAGAPVILHEYGGYLRSLPDLGLIDRFTGAVDPLWLKGWKAKVAQMGLAQEYATFWRNSLRLLNIARKHYIEQARLNASVTGYTYWLMTDYPAGTPESPFSTDEGWVNYFWEPKGFQPADARSFNAPVAILTDLGLADRVLIADQARTVKVSVSNYGGRDLLGPRITWRFSMGNTEVAAGTLPTRALPLGAVTVAGEVRTPALNLETPQRLQLRVDLADGDLDQTNTWDLWMLPHSPAAGATPSSRVLVAKALDQQAVRQLESGGDVLLLANRERMRGLVPVTFFSGFGRALGTRVESSRALGDFPHDGFMDLQFFNMMDGASAALLSRWPRSLSPIVEGLNYTAEERLAFLFELRVGQGRLLVTTLNLDAGRPEGSYLLSRLLQYMGSQDFRPALEMTPRAVLEALAG